jgi:acyl-CoA dehydrogenase
VSENESLIAETATRIFSDLADPQVINGNGDGSWKAPLWEALAQSGLTLAWVPEELGGAGAHLADGFAIISLSGRFALPVALTETLLAGWLLSQAGISSPAGPMSVAPTHPSDRITLNPDGTLSGHARCVPFARDARHLAVCADAGGRATIALVETDACRIAHGQNLAGDALDTVTLDRARPREAGCAPEAVDQKSLMLMGATTRAQASAGALEKLLDLSVRYANERVAFDRPIGRFQVVQHNLARLAGEVAAAMTAAGSAADTIIHACIHADGFDDAVFLEVASAKIRSAEAATAGAAIAHQIHGAIGFTREHILHRFTLRLLAWRDDFGNESHWAAALGNAVIARDADEFWPFMASR